MKTYRVTVNGNAYDVTVEETNGAAPSAYAPAPIAAPTPVVAPVAAAKPAAEPTPAPTPVAKPAAATGATKLNSPLPGTILKILVKEGQQVEKGQVAFIVEAMKMENEIVAPATGAVASIHVSEGTAVNAGDLLMSM